MLLELATISRDYLFIKRSVCWLDDGISAARMFRVNKIVWELEAELPQYGY